MRHFLKRTLRGLGLQIVRAPAPLTLERHLLDLIAQLETDCVLDVGANQGQYAAMIRSLGYRGWIVSFEPMPASVQILHPKISRDPRWLLYPVALGSEAAQAELHVYRNTQLTSLLPMTRQPRHLDEVEAAPSGTLHVEVATLGDLFPEIDRATGARSYFLKSDTQGYDLKVLSGGAGVLDRVLGLQIELPLKPFYERSSSAESILDALRGYGYQPTGFFPVARDPDLTLVEVDCVARRPSLVS